MADQLNVEKALLERDAKANLTKLHDMQVRLDEAARNLSNLEASRNKLSGENSDFERKLNEAECQVSQLQKLKVSLEAQLDNATKLAEDEAKERLQLTSRYRNIEGEQEMMRHHLEETLEEKEDLKRQLSRANGDATLWRTR